MIGIISVIYACIGVANIAWHSDLIIELSKKSENERFWTFVIFLAWPFVNIFIQVLNFKNRRQMRASKNQKRLKTNAL